jgi:hypothetical protein
MARHFGFALKFKSSLSFDAMWKRLEQAVPWRWKASDSDNYGDKLWCYAEDAAKVQILGKKPDWIVQVSFLPDVELTPDDMRRLLDEKVFPAIGATDIEPTETVS